MLRWKIRMLTIEEMSVVCWNLNFTFFMDMWTQNLLGSSSALWLLLDAALAGAGTHSTSGFSLRSDNVSCLRQEGVSSVVGSCWPKELSLSYSLDVCFCHIVSVSYWTSHAQFFSAAASFSAWFTASDTWSFILGVLSAHCIWHQQGRLCGLCYEKLRMLLVLQSNWEVGQRKTLENTKHDLNRTLGTLCRGVGSYCW